MNWIFFALIAPIFHSLSNIIDKYSLDRQTIGIFDFGFFNIIGGTIVGLFLYFVVGIDALSPGLVVLALASGFTLNVGFMFYFKALLAEEATRATPLFQLIPVFVLILGYFFFGEIISSVHLLGFFVIFGGGLFLNINYRDLRRIRLSKSFWWMIASAFVVSVSVLLSDTALEQSAFINIFTIELFGYALAGIALMVVPIWRKEIIKGIRTATLKKYQVFLLNDGIDLAAQFFYMMALIGAPSAALVAVMGGIQPFYLLILVIITSLYFPKILKENISKRDIYEKVFGMLIIFVGVLLISLA